MTLAIGHSAFGIAQAATNAAALPATLRDIKGPIQIGSPWTTAWRVGGILLVALLLGLAWWWWSRRHPSTPEGDTTSPADRARQRLAAVLGLIGEPERFVTEVSEAARTYLEERFGMHAPDRTTEEFLDELRGSVALDFRHKDLLAGFLTSCDLVKFARAEPGLAELEAMHHSALRLVNETAPSTQPAAPPPVLPAEPAAKP